MDLSMDRTMFRRQEITRCKPQYPTTKAIRCETLIKNTWTRPHMLEKENSMKFIAESSLQRAVQKARSDLHYMLRQPEEIFDVCEQCPKKNIAQKVQCVPSTIETTPPTPCPRNLKIHSKASSEKNLAKLKNSSLKKKCNEEITQIDDNCLSTNDLKWLGKNYSCPGGKIIFTNKKTKEAKYSNTTPLKFQKSPQSSQEIQHEIHKTAFNLVKRVQLHEQQLWKQLAEMSLSSASASTTMSNPLEENKFSSENDYVRSFSSFGFPPVFIVPQETIDEQKFAAVADSASSVSLDKDLSVSTVNILSLFGDDWFDNLLREELEIS